jgi:hypothetical protein
LFHLLSPPSHTKKPLQNHQNLMILQGPLTGGTTSYYTYS